jgi:hypothetical protein
LDVGSGLLLAVGAGGRDGAAGAVVTRAEQIDAVLALLEPPPSERGGWRRQIEHVLGSIDWRCKTEAGFKAPVSKKGKPALRCYVKALGQLQAAYDALPLSMRPWFSLSESAYVAGKPSVIDRELAKAEPLLAKSVPPKRDAVLGKAAVAAAYHLLLLRGHKPNLTRGGKWERLAKVLANGAPVFEHMRRLRRGVRIVRLKGKDGTALLVRSEQ